MVKFKHAAIGKAAASRTQVDLAKSEKDQLQHSCALQTCLSAKKAVNKNKKTYSDYYCHFRLPVLFLMLTDIAFLQRVHEGNSFEAEALSEQRP